MVVAFSASRKSISPAQFLSRVRQLSEKAKEKLEQRKIKMIKDALAEALTIPDRPRTPSPPR